VRAWYRRREISGRPGERLGALSHRRKKARREEKNRSVEQKKPDAKREKVRYSS